MKIKQVVSLIAICAMSIGAALTLIGGVLAITDMATNSNAAERRVINRTHDQIADASSRAWRHARDVRTEMREEWADQTARVRALTTAQLATLFEYDEVNVGTEAAPIWVDITDLLGVDSVEGVAEPTNAQIRDAAADLRDAVMVAENNFFRNGFHALDLDADVYYILDDMFYGMLINRVDRANEQAAERAARRDALEGIRAGNDFMNALVARGAEVSPGIEVGDPALTPAAALLVTGITLLIVGGVVTCVMKKEAEEAPAPAAKK